MINPQKITLDNLVDYTQEGASSIQSIALNDPSKTNHLQHPPSITPNEIELAHDEGYKLGYEKARAEAICESEHIKNSKEIALLDRIHNALRTAYKPIQIENEKIQKEIIDSCSHFLKDIAKRMNSKNLENNIEALIEPIQEIASSQSAILQSFNICIHPDDVQIAQPLLDKHKNNKSSDSLPVSLKTDATLQRGDCIIEWNDGAIAQRFSKTEAHIDKIFSQIAIKNESGDEVINTNQLQEEDAS